MGMRVAEDLHKIEAPVVIKKYANRRLYNTESSSYVTLDHLSQMVKKGTSFEVHDARSGDDITHSVLTQIIFEEEAKGQNLLPIAFLRQIIRLYGDPMQAFVPGYLDLSMETFTKNEDEMRRRIASAFGGGHDAVEHLARQNMAVFERAMQMFTPQLVEEAPPPPQQPTSVGDLSELKGEIEEMRRQIAELSQRK
jgi:polyhydroxyalkanoate synthesis repressor PhaR